MKHLAIVTTHPIQYNAPLFRLLTKRGTIQIKVFYTWGETVMSDKYDPGFQKKIQWDIPLLDGYEYEWMKNISPKPGSDHFRGIVNPDLCEKIIAYQPDGILVFGWSFHSHLQLLRKLHGKVKILFRGDSTLLDNKGGVKNVLRQICLSWVYQHVDIALYVGEENRKYYLRYGLKKSQLIHVPHAIDNDRFNFDEHTYVSALEMRKAIGIPDNAVVFLFAGKMEKKKNPLLLLNAFLKLNAADCHLLMVGNGELAEELKSKASTNPFIHFMDFQNQQQMPLIYHMADVFVLPSAGPGETWGLAVNEAMAARTAVIVSNKCGCAVDLVNNANNGFVFRSGDIDALLDCMSQLTNRRTTEMFGNNSQQIINKYSFAAIADAIESVV